MQADLSSPMLGVAALCGTLALFAGCSKTTDNTVNYTRAIDAYYDTHPVCLWPEPVQFPVQVETSDEVKTAGYNALVDQGLLVRTTAESTKVNSYDVSDKGRSALTPDPQEPGYVNFCYGHKKVKGIESSTPTTSDEGAITQVNFHTTVSDAPSWATAAETQNAYPKVHTALSAAQTGEATLIHTRSGWQVGRIRPMGS